MVLKRGCIPEPLAYFESVGLRLKGASNAKWRTTECRFHGGSDSMRINTRNGAWVCMAGCGARGGDVLAYQMASHGQSFKEAAMALGAWTEDGEPHQPCRASALPLRAALEALWFESTIVAVAAENIAQGREISDVDRIRLQICANRIGRLAESFSK